MSSYNLVFCGDSITAGFDLGTPTTQRYSRLVTNALSTLGFTVTENNIAVNGAYIDNQGQGATADGLYSGSYTRNVCAVFFGPNDMASYVQDETAATFYANLQSFAAARRAVGFFPVILTTLPLNTDPGFEARRVASNGSVLADHSWYDAVADIGNTSTTMGATSAAADNSLYGDGVHPTVLGHSLLEPAVTAAIRSVITPYSRYGVQVLLQPA